MNHPRPFDFTGRIRSFRFAFRGLRIMLMSQHNARVHALATLVACALGYFLSISRGDWCWIAIVIVVVWTAEALNTAFELLCDAASPEFHPLIEQAKNVAAGAVLVSAIGSVVVGLLVFGPRLLSAV